MKVKRFLTFLFLSLFWIHLLSLMIPLGTAEQPVQPTQVAYL